MRQRAAVVGIKVIIYTQQKRGFLGLVITSQNGGDALYAALCYSFVPSLVIQPCASNFALFARRLFGLGRIPRKDRLTIGVGRHVAHTHDVVAAVDVVHLAGHAASKVAEQIHRAFTDVLRRDVAF